MTSLLERLVGGIRSDQKRAAEDTRSKRQKSEDEAKQFLQGLAQEFRKAGFVGMDAMASWNSDSHKLWPNVVTGPEPNTGEDGYKLKLYIPGQFATIEPGKVQTENAHVVMIKAPIHSDDLPSLELGLRENFQSFAFFASRSADDSSGLKPEICDATEEINHEKQRKDFAFNYHEHENLSWNRRDQALGKVAAWLSKVGWSPGK